MEMWWQHLKLFELTGALMNYLEVLSVVLPARDRRSSCGRIVSYLAMLRQESE